jgi:hypothetical protein
VHRTLAKSSRAVCYLGNSASRQPVAGPRTHRCLDHRLPGTRYTASAPLIGLLFVAFTLAASISTPRAVAATSACLTPTLVHFGSVLFQYMWVLLTDQGYEIYIVLVQRKIDFATPKAKRRSALLPTARDGSGEPQRALIG